MTNLGSPKPWASQDCISAGALLPSACTEASDAAAEITAQAAPRQCKQTTPAKESQASSVLFCRNPTREKTCGKQDAEKHLYEQGMQNCQESVPHRFIFSITCVAARCGTTAMAICGSVIDPVRPSPQDMLLDTRVIAGLLLSSRMHA